jgi:tetratricopeptide (TPR) repeat protein
MSRKSAIYFILLFTLSLLHSVPEYSISFPKQNIRENFGSIIDFVVENEIVYLLDYKNEEIIKYSTINDSIIGKLKFSDEIAKPSKLLLHNDHFYIANTGESNIIILTKDGKIVQTIGDKKGSHSDLRSPVDVEINSYNQIYVLDSGSKEIFLFNEDGFFLRSISIAKPIAICLDISQNIHVLQQRNKKIVIDVFDHYLNKINTIQTITQSKELSLKITDFVINDFGEYYISDNSNCFFLKLNSDGEEIWNFGVKSKDPLPGYFSSTQSIFIQPEGEKEIIYFLDRKHGLIQRYLETPEEASIKLVESEFPILFEFAGNDTNEFNDILFIEDKKYIINSDEPAFYCLKGKEIIFKIDEITSEEKGIKFGKPEKMVALDDFIFVTDSGTNKVHVFGLDGSYIRFFGEKGKEEGKLINPKGIVVDHDGNLCIADNKNNRLSIFSKKGIFQKCYKNDILQSPSDLALNNRGELFVLSNSSIVYRIDKDYSIILRLSLSTLKISAIECIVDDILAVIDDNKQKLILLKHDLDVLMELGCKGSKKDSDQFAEIYAIGFNNEQNLIFVSDKAATNAKKLKLLIRPDSPTNVNLVVSSENEVKLHWDDSQQASGYNVYYRNSIDLEPMLKQNTKSNELKLTESSKFSLEYAVTAISIDSLESELSTWITDRFSYGKYLEENSNLSEAADVYFQLYETNPQYNHLKNNVVEIYRSIAKNYKKRRDYENTLFYLQKALALNPENRDVIFEKIQTYKLSKAYQDGIVFLQQSTLENLDKEEYWKTIVSLYYLNKNYYTVIELALNYKENNPESTEIDKMLARSYENLQLYSEALQIYKIIAKSGLNEDIVNVAEIWVKLQRYEEAILLYKKVISSNYTDNNIFHKLGVTYFLNNKLGDAAIQFERAISNNPENPDNYFYLGKTYQKDRKLQEAIKSYQQAIILDSTRYEYSYEISQALKTLNRFDEAISALQRAAVFVPGDSTSIPIHVELGKLLMIKKDYDKALYEFTIANNLFPVSTEIQGLLAKSKTARIEYNKSRNPIEIEDVTIDMIYPSLKEYYQSHPIAVITLFNTREIPVEDIILELEINDIIEKKWELIVSSVLPNESQSYPVTVVFNDSLLANSKDGEITKIAEIKANYVFAGKEYEVNTTKELKILGLNAISWNNKKQIASFINPLDPVIREFVLNEIINPFDENTKKTTFNKEIKQVIQLYNFLAEYGIHYISDPNQAIDPSGNCDIIDFVQPAIQTIQDKGGDCEDLVVLLSSIMESIGIKTAYIDVPGHVMVAFDTGMSKNDASEKGFDPKMYIETNDTCWMPVETTLIGKESLYRSWISGMNRYNEILQKGLLPEIFIIAEAHNLFSPVLFKGEINLKDPIDFDIILESYKSDLKTFLDLTSISQEQEFLDILTKYPKNNHVKNKLATWYIVNTQNDLAIKLLNEILDEDKNNLVALNNLGNLKLQANNYNRAAELYLKALDIKNLDDGIFQNLAVLELKRENCEKARFYFFKIEDKETLRNNNPQLILEILKK